MDNEGPDFPPNITRAFSESKMDVPYDLQIYADFEVCPLEPEETGAMQAACIESARNIVVKKH